MWVTYHLVYEGCRLASDRKVQPALTQNLILERPSLRLVVLNGTYNNQIMNNQLPPCCAKSERISLPAGFSRSARLTQKDNFKWSKVSCFAHKCLSTCNQLSLGGD